MRPISDDQGTQYTAEYSMGCSSQCTGCVLPTIFRNAAASRQEMQVLFLAAYQVVFAVKERDPITICGTALASPIATHTDGLVSHVLNFIKNACYST